jgi:hypothetical protein
MPCTRTATFHHLTAVDDDDVDVHKKLDEKSGLLTA